MNIKKTKIFTCLYVLLIFSILVGAWCLVWTVYRHDFVRNVDNSLNYPHLNEAQLTQLSLGASHLESDPFSYAHQTVRSSEEKRVIGLFGGSFVSGYNSTRSVAYYLQKEFQSSAQVINFGVGSYGLHQSFLLWNYLHKKFHLTDAIFFPKAFHWERDLGFIYPAIIENLQKSTILHGRYVMTSKGVSFQKVLGQSRQEALDIYFQLFPRWYYLNYGFYELPQLWMFHQHDEGAPVRFSMADKIDEKKRMIYQTYHELFRQVAEKIIFQFTLKTVKSLSFVPKTNASNTSEIPSPASYSRRTVIQVIL